MYSYSIPDVFLTFEDIHSFTYEKLKPEYICIPTQICICMLLCNIHVHKCTDLYFSIQYVYIYT